MTKRTKKPREPILTERPLLSEMIYDFARLADRSMTQREWHECFYHMAQQSTAPRCVRELWWETATYGYPFSHDLNDILSFIAALQQCKLGAI